MGQAGRADVRDVPSFDEYKNWLASAVDQLATPFAATYTAWLRDNHGQLSKLLFEPQRAVCTSL